MRTAFVLAAFVLASLLFVQSVASAQETARDLTGPGEFTKYLTRGQADTWAFDGEKDETIIADVETKEFDSLLGLSVSEGKKDKLLFEVDDPGTNSRFSVRLPKKGHYKIRVRAFKDEGGGNYSLHVVRFLAAPLLLGKTSVGTFDGTGKGFFHFKATRGQILTTQVQGAAADEWKMLDGKGNEMPQWLTAATVAADGEFQLALSGRPGGRYGVLVRQAQQEEITTAKTASGQLQAGEMRVWNFAGKPGDFRLLEIEKKGEIEARVLYAEGGREHERRLASSDDWPELRFLPAASGGGRMRFAVVLGREGNYQLQVLAQTASSYKLSLSDPSAPLAWDQAAKDTLPVGGTVFYSFEAAAGRLIHVGLSTQKFVPLMQLYDARGNLVAKSEASSNDLQSRITHMIARGGAYHLQISSVGDGGGGDYEARLAEVKVKELAIGSRGQGTLAVNAADFWAFSGKAGQTVFINARSPLGNPTIALRGPDGVELEREDRGNEETGSLLAVKLPKTGRYVVWVASPRGSGPYSLRLIDGD